MNTINSFSELGVVDNVYANSAEPEPDAVNKSVVKTEPDPPAIVTLSFDASVVNVIPEPASNVNVSFVESAATLLCPLTAIVPNALSPVAEFVIVSVSVPGVVVNVIPVPAANVSVSVVESASIFVCGFYLWLGLF